MAKYIIYIYWSGESKQKYNTYVADTNLALELEPPHMVGKWAWRTLTAVCGYLYENPNSMSGIEVYSLNEKGKEDKLIFYKYRKNEVT